MFDSADNSLRQASSRAPLAALLFLKPRSCDWVEADDLAFEDILGSNRIRACGELGDTF
jgi:hypothetical protein